MDRAIGTRTDANRNRSKLCDREITEAIAFAYTYGEFDRARSNLYMFRTILN